jgi:methylmalonyl-CoA decarboxylase subunit alpha
VPPSPGGPAPPGCLREATDRVARRRREAVDGPDTTTRRSAQGRMTARERIDLLLDDGSFVELGAFARHRATGFGIEHRRPDTDGVVTGWGTVDGRRVCVFAHDPRIFGGALGEVFATKIQTLMDLAESMGVPIVGLNEGGGARIQEGVDALAGFGGIFRRNVRASGVVPPSSVRARAGPCTPRRSRTSSSPSGTRRGCSSRVPTWSRR